MSRYLAWIDTPLNQQIEMVAHLEWAGVVVPVKRCEHGNIDPHPTTWPAYASDRSEWCPGAGIGGDE